MPQISIIVANTVHSTAGTATYILLTYSTDITPSTQFTELSLYLWKQWLGRHSFRSAILNERCCTAVGRRAVNIHSSKVSYFVGAATNFGLVRRELIGPAVGPHSKWRKLSRLTQFFHPTTTKARWLAPIANALSLAKLLRSSLLPLSSVERR